MLMRINAEIILFPMESNARISPPSCPNSQRRTFRYQMCTYFGVKFYIVFILIAKFQCNLAVVALST